MDVDIENAMASDSATVVQTNTENADKLSATVYKQQSLDDKVVNAMYALYAKHYCDTTKQVFTADLNTKTHVLLLQDSSDNVCGFTTIELYNTNVTGHEISVIFSGDTIVDPKLWGQTALAFEWLRFIGKIKKHAPDKPLYWLLIVKGHRTYRYLSTFALCYTPHHSNTASSQLSELLNKLASDKFNDCFNASTGIARFGPNSGHLNEQLAEIPATHSKRADVDYFLKRNPGYQQGDELVCLCELSENNMRPLAKRIFLSV